MKVDVPLGDIVDRITINRIKVARIQDEARAQHARNELNALTEAWQEAGHSPLDDLPETLLLAEVNGQLWDVEDALRQRESHQDFGDSFVQLARQVYALNDRRAAHKRAINTRLDSSLVEVKSYVDPTPPAGLRVEHALTLFATRVLIASVPDAERLNKTLRRRIKKIRREQPLWKGHTSPWQCPPNLHEDDAFSILVDHIQDAAARWSDLYRYTIDRLEITAMWANRLERGEVHRPHSHGNNLISGVYYVEAGQGDSLTLHHPNPAAHALCPGTEEWTPHNTGDWTIPAAPGRLVLFPSWCRHWVPPTPNAERISLAFNLLCRGDLDQSDSLQAVRL